jgi:N4-(beta-N-acetylglucosaminyl)-L-asparaginase
MSMTRRDFVRSAAVATAAGVVSSRLPRTATAQDDGAKPRGKGGPMAISSANGIRTCNKAMELIAAGEHPLDAVVAGINIVEEDATDHSVGYGGLPNEDGVVELDSCVMDGPTHKAGAVAALRNIKTPSRVALKVMRRTDHVLLVGEGALRFARAHGFEECNLLTDEARKEWLKWKETHSDVDDWLGDPKDAGDEQSSSRRRLQDLPEFTYGTISCMALTAGGDLAGCTTTSGLSYKIPGRVGDSPIIGAGLYVDNEVGACGSTGRGEANLQNCSCFMVVEFMRNGMTPEEACLAMLKRVAHKTEPRLLNKDGKPDFGLRFYALRKDGLFGGASMWGHANMTVHTGGKARHIQIPALCGERPEQT